MSILTIDHISKYYNLDGTNQERALNDVTLEIAPAKITAIYGPSGCGKTSLLSIREIFISKIRTCVIFQSVT